MLKVYKNDKIEYKVSFRSAVGGQIKCISFKNYNTAIVFAKTLDVISFIDINVMNEENTSGFSAPVAKITCHGVLEVINKCYINFKV